MDQAPELNRNEVMTRRFQLVEEIALIAGKHKAELAPLSEELGMCEAFIKDSMNQAGEQQFKTTAGDMCFFVTKDSATVENMDSVISTVLTAAPPPAELGITDPELWQRVLGHIQSSGMWGLLNNAVNKTAVKEMVTATNIIPPGVKYSSYRDLSWRRGKGEAKAA